MLLYDTDISVCMDNCKINKSYQRLVGGLLDLVMYSLWMVRNLWSGRIVFLYISSCNFIEVNHYVQISFLCTAGIMLRTHNPWICCYSIRRLYSFIPICTKSNIIDFLSEYTMCLTPELLLWSLHCFTILQAVFVVLKSYFSFDHFFYPLLPCQHDHHLWDCYTS